MCCFWLFLSWPMFWRTPPSQSQSTGSLLENCGGWMKVGWSRRPSSDFYASPRALSDTPERAIELKWKLIDDLTNDLTFVDSQHLMISVDANRINIFFDCIPYFHELPWVVQSWCYTRFLLLLGWWSPNDVRSWEIVLRIFVVSSDIICFVKLPQQKVFVNICSCSLESPPFVE